MAQIKLIKMVCEWDTGELTKILVEKVSAPTIEGPSDFTTAALRRVAEAVVDGSITPLDEVVEDALDRCEDAAAPSEPEPVSTVEDVPAPSGPDIDGLFEDQK
jgi:hypothetical protein